MPFYRRLLECLFSLYFDRYSEPIDFVVLVASFFFLSVFDCFFLSLGLSQSIHPHIPLPQVYGCPSYLINHPFHDISENFGETGDNLCHVTILAKPALGACDGCAKAKLKCLNSDGT